MAQQSVQGSSAPINIPLLARQRFAGFKDDEDEQHTGIIPPHLLAAQVSLELAEASFACLVTGRGAVRLLLTSVVTPHLLAVLIRRC